MHNEQSTQTVTEHTAENGIDNRYDILDQICKDTELYPRVKHHESKRDGQGAYYAIYLRWLGWNQVHATATEAKMALQTSTYEGKKKTEVGKNMLPNMSSTIFSWKILGT